MATRLPPSSLIHSPFIIVLAALWAGPYWGQYRSEGGSIVPASVSALPPKPHLSPGTYIPTLAGARTKYRYRYTHMDGFGARTLVTDHPPRSGGLYVQVTPRRAKKCCAPSERSRQNNRGCAISNGLSQRGRQRERAHRSRRAASHSHTGSSCAQPHEGLTGAAHVADSTGVGRIQQGRRAAPGCRR